MWSFRRPRLRSRFLFRRQSGSRDLLEKAVAIGLNDFTEAAAAKAELEKLPR
jgi:hypothetical protein